MGVDNDERYAFGWDKFAPFSLAIDSSRKPSEGRQQVDTMRGQMS